jgi:glutathione synthase/RimK-type ligase-like ATP-grasp enzyme
VKLILAHNQTDRFVDFYAQLQQQSTEPFDYVAYDSLLFIFDNQSEVPLSVINLANTRTLTDYDGVYINGYLETYEAAAAVAICCDALNVPYVNHELHNPPSLSKLTSYAKLSSANVPIPRTYAGSRLALETAADLIPADIFPGVLKRADADQGIDNFMVCDLNEMKTVLSDYDISSSWLLQPFIPNDGFYLVSFYNQEPAFSIFRSLEKRPDANASKAHMYKPQGGSNASLVELENVPKDILTGSVQAIRAMNRHIGSVDCLTDNTTGKSYVLEVNYNPQLVTIETFKDVRVKAFLQNLAQQWHGTEPPTLQTPSQSTRP